MWIYEFSDKLTPEFLLAELRKEFYLRDEVVTQSIIDNCFSVLHGDIDQIEKEYLDIVFSITDKFSNPSIIRFIYVLIQHGPSIYADGQKLKLPKIFVRY